MPTMMAGTRLPYGFGSPLTVVSQTSSPAIRPLIDVPRRLPIVTSIGSSHDDPEDTDGRDERVLLRCGPSVGSVSRSACCDLSTIFDFLVPIDSTSRMKILRPSIWISTTLPI